VGQILLFYSCQQLSYVVELNIFFYIKSDKLFFEIRRKLSGHTRKRGRI